jgi:hypothetical protein
LLALVARVNYGSARAWPSTFAFCDGDLAAFADAGVCGAICSACGTTSDGVRFTLREVTDSVQPD